MIRKKLSALMAEVGPLANLLMVDEDRKKSLWRLMFDENSIIYAELDEPRRMLVFSAEIAAPREGGRLELYDLILRYHHAWDSNGGARVSLSEDDRLWLSANVAVDGLDIRFLCDIVVDLAQKRAGWREIVERFPGGEIDREERLDMFSTPGVIRG